jgi:GNAT superfamily N-acetyltransferase
MIDIRPVADRRSLRAFIEFPYGKYRGHPHWVPPLRLSERAQFDRAKNPFYQTADIDLFTAWESGRMAGRVAAIDDRAHNQTHKDNIAAFGFFEATSAEAASALLGRVEQFAAAHGRTAVRGPLNPSLNHSAGFQIDAFDTDPFLMMPYNPPEYPTFVEAAGYAKVKDLYSWLLDPREAPESRLTALAGRLQQRYKVVIRRVNLGDIGAESERIREIYSEAWKDNWGFVPPSREEFWHIVKDLKSIIEPDGALIAEVGGRPVGCAIAAPDVNEVIKPANGRLFPLGLLRLLLRRRIVTRWRVVIVGVIDEYRDKGVLPLLMAGLMANARGHRCLVAECSWTLEDNLAVNLALSQGGARHYKTYRLYQKSIA